MRLCVWRDRHTLPKVCTLVCVVCVLTYSVCVRVSGSLTCTRCVCVRASDSHYMCVSVCVRHVNHMVLERIFTKEGFAFTSCCRSLFKPPLSRPACRG